MRNDIIFGAVLPYIAFLAARHFGLSTVHALAIGALFPLAAITVSYAINRRIAAISIITLTATLASLAASLWFNSAYLALLKNSLITGAVGLVFLGSLLAPRPLVFFLASEGGSEKRSAHESYWQMRAGYRRTIRQMTLIWGVVLIAEACARAVLIPLLPVNVFLVVSEVMWIVVFAGMIIWSIRHGKRRSEALDTNDEDI